MKRWSSSLLSVAVLFGASMLPGVAEGAEPVPVLWEGVVQNPNGSPAAAEVVAYVRPAAAELGSGNALTEVARTRTDGSGRYTLHAAPTAAIGAVEDEAGWVTVMVVAFGDDGTITMAMDSLAWQPDGGRGGVRAASAGDRSARWVTTPAQRIRAEAGNGLVRAASAEAQDIPEIETERPSVMVLADPPGNSVVSAQGASVGPRVPMCVGPMGSKPLGVHLVDVGEIHVNRDWKGRFVYKQASSTSFQVGMRWEGDGWSVAGSTSSVEGRVRRAGNEFLRRPNLYTYAAEVIFEQYSWKCEVGAEYKWLYTLEPERWTTGLPRTDGGAPPPCNPRYKATVSPEGFLEREDGSSTTHEAAMSVRGFSGSTTTTTSQSVYQKWDNLRDEQRYLCGTTNYPDRNTRVHSPA